MPLLTYLIRRGIHIGSDPDGGTHHTHDSGVNKGSGSAKLVRVRREEEREGSLQSQRSKRKSTNKRDEPAARGRGICPDGRVFYSNQTGAFRPKGKDVRVADA